MSPQVHWLPPLPVSCGRCRGIPVISSPEIQNHPTLISSHHQVSKYPYWRKTLLGLLNIQKIIRRSALVTVLHRTFLASCWSQFSITPVTLLDRGHLGPALMQNWILSNRNTNRIQKRNCYSQIQKYKAPNMEIILRREKFTHENRTLPTNHLGPAGLGLVWKMIGTMILIYIITINHNDH